MLTYLFLSQSLHSKKKGKNIDSCKYNLCRNFGGIIKAIYYNNTERTSPINKRIFLEVNIALYST